MCIVVAEVATAIISITIAVTTFPWTVYYVISWSLVAFSNGDWLLRSLDVLCLGDCLLWMRNVLEIYCIFATFLLQVLINACYALLAWCLYWSLESHLLLRSVVDHNIYDVFTLKRSILLLFIDAYFFYKIERLNFIARLYFINSFLRHTNQLINLAPSRISLEVDKSPNPSLNLLRL